MKPRIAIRLMAIVAMAGMLMTACGKDNGREDGKVYITVKANNDSFGQVTGSGAYDKGAEVRIAAYPAVGYSFSKWDDGNTDNPRTVVANEDKTYTAVFVSGNGGNNGGEVVGDGTITVTWNGETWTTTDLYAVSYDNGSVTMELYKDATDPQSKVILINMPMRAGTFYASQSDFSFMCVLYNYSGESFDYQGQPLPPYQPAQGLYMTVDAIDVENHRFTGIMSGNFIYMGDYLNNNMNLFNVTVQFSAAKWIDVAD